MAESQVGVKAVCWGIYTGISYSGISTPQTGGHAGFEIQSTNFGKEADKKEVRNSKGQTVTEIFHNFKRTLSIEVLPIGQTKEYALAGEILPNPGDIITITEAAISGSQADPETAATNGGKYVCDRASKTKSNTDEHKMTFEMHQFTENDTAVVVAASV